jgi:hypothetical protein
MADSEWGDNSGWRIADSKQVAVATGLDGEQMKNRENGELNHAPA